MGDHRRCGGSYRGSREGIPTAAVLYFGPEHGTHDVSEQSRIG
jgi:hypothetical protein